MQEQKFIIFLICITLTASLLIAVYTIRHATQERSAMQGAVIGDQFGSDVLPPASDTVLAPSLHVISSTRVLAPVASQRASAGRYCTNETGQVFESSLGTGRTTTISSVQLPDLMETVWSPDRQQVISLFKTKQGPRWRYFNYATRTSTALPMGITTLVFSPNGNQIAYFLPNELMGGIYFSQPDGSIPKKILATRVHDMQLYWPDSEFLYAQIPHASGTTADVFQVHSDGSMASVVADQEDLQVVFNHSGTRVAYSSRDGAGLVHLFVQDIGDSTGIDLGVSTFASKCTWNLDSSALLCGVPVSPTANSAFVTSEEIREIHIIDKTQRVVYAKSSDASSISVRELFLSPLEDFLVFLNAYDEKLYALTLPK